MISNLTQAILLLTTHLKKNEENDVRPLTPTEWGRFAAWLKEQGLTPDRLLFALPAEVLKDWRDAKITVERIEALLDRGSALALAVEKWERSGLWIITRADADYPLKLKEKLGPLAPPVLFGCGNRNLINQRGVAVVGSRNVNDTDLRYSRELGAFLANCGFSVISGGARGVDEAAMAGALEIEGTAVGVLANGLLQASLSQKYREYLRQKSLALISPFNPEAGFDVGNAMQRNKYIYCLSDAAVAVHSGTKGGTWSGALENLKKKWAPLWVKRTDDPQAGNRLLVQKGARWLPEKVDEIQCEWFLNKEVQQDLFSFNAQKKERQTGEISSTKIYEGTKDKEKQIKETAENKSAGAKNIEDAENSGKTLTLYDFFLTELKKLCSSKGRSIEEIASELELQKSQANVWLKKALSDGVIKKLNKPARYYWNKDKQKSLPLD